MEPEFLFIKSSKCKRQCFFPKRSSRILKCIIKKKSVWKHSIVEVRRPGRRTQGWTAMAVAMKGSGWIGSGSVKEASGLVEWREGDKTVKSDSQLSGLTKHVNCDPICCDVEGRERWVIF